MVLTICMLVEEDAHNFLHQISVAPGLRYVCQRRSRILNSCYSLGKQVVEINCCITVSITVR